MKLHVGCDLDTGLVHSLATTAANAADVATGAECRVYTGGLGVFSALEELEDAHTKVVAAGRRARAQIKSARSIKVVLANIKRSLFGLYHSIRQRKYGRRYLAQAGSRFNRRFELKALLLRRTVATVAFGPHSERELLAYNELCALRFNAN
jgi:hypothetical protein